MLYTRLTRKAMQIAYNAHDGQFDKMGVPYVYHPIHLAEQMGDDEYAICVALLHDTIEDTSITFFDLMKEFPTEIVEAIKLLTRNGDMSYNDYVTAISKSNNNLAIKVKLADLEHNSSPGRLQEELLGHEAVERLREKYDKAKEILKKG